MSTAVAVFCGKSKEKIIREGGTQSWRLVPANAAQHEFVVCCRSGVDWVEGNEERGSAFLVGRIAGVVRATDTTDERYLIQMSEYAEVDVAHAWKGWRNPVKYTTLEELGIDLSGLAFEPIARGVNASTLTPAAVLALTTKEDVNSAYEQWKVARDRMAYEHGAFALVLQSRDMLISSIASTHGWNAAQADFKRHIDAHQLALTAAIKNEETAAKNYVESKQRFAAIAQP